jgi:hypothetical protein
MILNGPVTHTPPIFFPAKWDLSKKDLSQC